MTTKPTTEQLQQSIHVICKVIGQIPCFHLYEEYVAHRFSSSEVEVSLRAMTHNAVLDSTLINLRCFNEFFGNSRHSDDIRADDFPCVKMHSFLCPDGMTTIHKYLAHITVTRLDLVTKPWLLDDMVLRGLQHGIAFLSIIETSFPPATDSGRAELRGVCKVVRRLIQNIAKL